MTEVPGSTHPSRKPLEWHDRPIAMLERRGVAVVGAGIAGAGTQAAVEEGDERARSKGGGSKVTAAKMGPSTWVLAPDMRGTWVSAYSSSRNCTLIRGSLSRCFKLRFSMCSWGGASRPLLPLLVKKAQAGGYLPPGLGFRGRYDSPQWISVPSSFTFTFISRRSGSRPIQRRCQGPERV